MGKQVTSKISPTQVGTGRSKQNLYTATKVSGPIGTPPTYITDIIKYDKSASYVNSKLAITENTELVNP